MSLCRWVKKWHFALQVCSCLCNQTSNNEFHGYASFTPAGKTSRRALPRWRFMMCSSMYSSSVSRNNRQLNHMALAHMKLTPALTSCCPDLLPHVHILTTGTSTITCNIGFQRDFWNSIRPTGTSVPRRNLWAEGWVGVCTHGTCMVC